MVPKFLKVMLRDYKRVLQAIGNALASGLSGDDSLNAASNAQLSLSTRVFTPHIETTSDQGHFILDLSDDFREFQPSKSKLLND